MKRWMFATGGIALSVMGVILMINAIYGAIGLPHQAVNLSPEDIPVTVPSLTEQNAQKYGLAGIALFTLGIFLITKTRKRRGQAAMEFLMTYGWAILAAIIAIGVLAYFGIFNPSNLAGSSAVLSPPWTVQAWNVKLNDGQFPFPNSEVINLELVFNGAKRATLADIAGTIIVTADSSSGFQGTCDTIATISGLGVVQPGEAISVKIYCGDEPTLIQAGDNFRGDITLRYTEGQSALEQVSTGSIRDTVVA